MSAQPVWQHLGLLLNSETQVQDVEIIPGTGEELRAQFSDNRYYPLVFSDGHLGVPSKVLFKSYMEVAHLYPSFRRIDDANIDDAILATAVILFANADHVSALNFRKGMLVCGRLDPARELVFLKLATMIPKNSRSSILWHHRRWVLDRLYPGPALGEDDDAWCPDLPAQSCEEELAIVAHACESYPRNYHAWSHRSCLLRLLQHRSLHDNHSASVQFVMGESSRLKAWIDSHISDYTAVQYFCQVQRVIQDMESSSRMPGQMLATSVADQSLEYFVELIQRYPDHETLWLGARVTLACLSEASELEKMEKLQDLRVVLLKGVSGVSSEEEPARARIYALRLWFWCLQHDGKAVYSADSVRAVLSCHSAPAIEQQCRHIHSLLDQA